MASPQSNGQVERVNRDLRAMLAKLTDPIEHGDWVERLSQVEFAINNTVHRSIGQTPSMMLFGVEQRGEIVDELTEYLQDIYGNTKRDLDSIREQVSHRIEKSQSYNLKYFNKHHKQPKSFNVGDLVVLKNVDTGAGVNKKLIPRYRGPYIIQKQLGND